MMPSTNLPPTVTFKFKGCSDSLEDLLSKGLFEVGDTYTVGQVVYCYAGDGFEPLSSVETVSSSPEWSTPTGSSQEVIEMKCNSCGAPVRIQPYSRSYYCEYCGSIYERRS